MRPKIIPGAALLLCGIAFSVAIAHGQPQGGVTNATPQNPSGNLLGVLYENGAKLGCYFTLEYQGYGITGHGTKATTRVTKDLNADSIDSLVSNLRDYMDTFVVVKDAKNPKIVHIIEKVLADDTNYALNKRITVNYSGSLRGTGIPVIPNNGSVTMVGGILSAVAEKVGGVIRAGSGDTTPTGMMSDLTTQVDIKATNETVRSIFTDCLPTNNYNPIMWRAVPSIAGGENCLLVQFFGRKR